MRVCDVTQSYHATSGGIRTYLEAKRRFILEKTDHEHVLIVPGAEDKMVRSDRCIDVTLRGAPIPASRGYRLILQLTQVRRVLSALAPDVLELATAYLLPGVHRLSLGLDRASVTAFYHTDFPDVYVEPAARKILGARMARRVRGAATRYVRDIHRTIDTTFVASRPYHEKLIAIGVPNVVRLPLGVDLETFHPRHRDERVRRRFGASTEDVVFLFAGRLDPEKNIDGLIDAFLRLPADISPRLWLVGNGPSRQRLIRELAGDSRVRILPFEPDRTQLAAVMASADVYATAAPHETFGLSVLEAQASGLPVAGVRAGALVDRVPPDVGNLADPGDSGDLTRVMAGIACGEYRAIGRRARQLVEREYGWHGTFETQFNRYEELVRGRQVQRRYA